MLYYTQLIYLKPGGEADFLAFEDLVLPLLEKYRGQLLLRWRSTPEAVIESNCGDPYEVHLVSFETVSDFQQYARDAVRQQHLPLKDRSVEKILLIEGRQL
ncbi:MAG: DUF1330 domain-containing protein [Saprospiraceae bacterium]|nr:DUF1330 domain-containing protein [Saprospiraceae bacterium]